MGASGNFSKKIYLIRHGETEWTLSGQHTGITDLPLTENGERDAALIGKELLPHKFKCILCSPLQRAKATCQKAGLFDQAVIEPLLKEWNYGIYEGKTTEEIHRENPGWTIFSKGAPRGESVADVSRRADELLQKIAPIDGDIALFSHGHFLRVLAARWLCLPAEKGSLFSLSPSSVSILEFERSNPVIALWNAKKLY